MRKFLSVIREDTTVPGLAYILNYLDYRGLMGKDLYFLSMEIKVSTRFRVRISSYFGCSEGVSKKEIQIVLSVRSQVHSFLSSQIAFSERSKCSEKECDESHAGQGAPIEVTTIFVQKKLHCGM